MSDPALEIDTQRLGDQAGVLGGAFGHLSDAQTNLSRGLAEATQALGTIDDGGLHGAVRALQSAWSYDTSAVSHDVDTLVSALKGIAQAYDQADYQGAQSLSP